MSHKRKDEEAGSPTPSPCAEGTFCTLKRLKKRVEGHDVAGRSKANQGEFQAMPEAAVRFPDGIAPRHLDGGRLSRQLANIMTFVVLAAIMGLALSGVLGGQANERASVDGSEARMEVSLPQTLRNGEMFDAEIVLIAKRDIAAPTVAISSSYWRDITINTIFPEPSEQASRNGAFLFKFDEMKRNDVIRMKIAGQVNPSLRGGNSGTIAISDGERTLAALPVKLEVLP